MERSDGETHSPDARTRSSWLARLEINDKIKDGLLSNIAQHNVGEALRLLDDGQAAKKDIRTKDSRSPTGLTALHLAALFDDRDVVLKLLELHADTNVTCYCQIASYSVATKFWMDARPLLFAIGAKNEHIVSMLLSQSSLVTMNDAWPLFSSEWWRLTGHFDWTIAQSILRSLVEHKLDLNQRVAKLRWSMLHYCVNMEPRDPDSAEEFVQGRYDTVVYLLATGADPLLKDTFGRTAYTLLEERATGTSTGNAEADALQSLKDDADNRLKELLQQAMVAQVDKVRAKVGFRGSLQRLAVRSQALDRVPLLRSGVSSLRRSSIASSGVESRVSEATLRS